MSTQKGQFVPTAGEENRGGKLAQFAKGGQRDTTHITLHLTLHYNNVSQFTVKHTHYIYVIISTVVRCRLIHGRTAEPINTIETTK